METIERDGILYAIVHRQQDWREGLAFLSPDELFCQVGTWWYQKDKKLDSHRHIHNERPNHLTQECIIVVEGSVRVDLYDNNNSIFQSETLVTGDIMILVKGGHGYEILEDDTKIVECKNGPFVSVEKDKVFIKED